MRDLDLTARAKKFLEGLAPRQFRQVVNKIFSLLEDPEPHDSHPLAGFPWRRADVGEYRIIYRIDRDTVKIPLVGSETPSGTSLGSPRPPRAAT